MRKLLQTLTVFFCTLCVGNAYAADMDYQQPMGQMGQMGQGGQQCCPDDHPCPDVAMNECWCLYVHYKPCYYTTRRCVEEKIPCTKRCCRMVDQYYQVERCRMVPEKYCETCCKKVPEYYDVPDCKICKKWVCDQHCQYVPQYYWKHSCGETTAPTAQPCPCPTYQPQGCCPR